MFSLRSYCTTADQQLNQLQQICEDGSRANACASCSAWPVLQHVEHLVLAGEVMLSRINDALKRSNEKPQNVAPLSKIGRLVLALGWIPRGKASAPKMTVPATSTSPVDLLPRIAQLRIQVQQLGTRLPEVKACRYRTMHPVLGGFTPAQWLRFLTIHQKHHLKIIAQIESTAPRAPATTP